MRARLSTFTFIYDKRCNGGDFRKYEQRVMEENKFFACPRMEDWERRIRDGEWWIEDFLIECWTLL